MPCYPAFPDKDGNPQGFMCGRNLKLKTCSCGALVEYLCDFPIGEKDATCDALLCPRCAFTIGRDIHLCSEHGIYYKENKSNLWLNKEIKRRHDIQTYNDKNVIDMCDALYQKVKNRCLL